MDHLHVVFPGLLGHDPSLKSSCLNRVPYQESKIDLGDFCEGLRQADCIDTGSNLFTRQWPEVVSNPQPAGLVKAHRVESQRSIKCPVEPVELRLKVGMTLGQK